MALLDYFQTWQEVMKKPSDFYRKMPQNEGYFYPVIFAISSIAIMFFFVFLIYPFIYPEINGTSTKLTYPEIFLILIFIFVVFIIGLFINAAILHITYKALGGTGSYRGTVGFICYATAALVLAWIPLIGWIFGSYQTYLYIVGGKFVHDMSTGKSVLAFLASGILVLIFVLLMSLVLV